MTPDRRALLEYAQVLLTKAHATINYCRVGERGNLNLRADDARSQAYDQMRGGVWALEDCAKLFAGIVANLTVARATGEHDE